MVRYATHSCSSMIGLQMTARSTVITYITERLGPHCFDEGHLSRD